MQIQYTNELFYPLECSFLFMRRLVEDRRPDERRLERPSACLAYLRESYGPAAEAVAAPIARIDELVDAVWEQCSFPRETLARYFSQDMRGGHTVGSTFAYLSRAGVDFAQLDGEKRFEVLRSLVLTNLCEGDDLPEVQPEAIRTEQALFDFIDHTDCKEELKWATLRLYHHADEYEREVRQILGEAEGHLRERAEPLRPAWEAAISRIRANVAEYGVSYLRDEYHIKPDGEEVLIAPSLMLLGSVGMQSGDLNWKGWSSGQTYMYIGFLADEIEQISKEYGANGALLCSRLKVISDKRRLEILRALRNSSLCGQELAELTGLTPATVSHHMAVLLQEDFVNIEREGTRLNYSLSQSGVERLIENLRRALL